MIAAISAKNVATEFSARASILNDAVLREGPTFRTLVVSSVRGFVSVRVTFNRVMYENVCLFYCNYINIVWTHSPILRLVSTDHLSEHLADYWRHCALLTQKY